MRCRECGCTDLEACSMARGEVVYVCWWAEEDLCSFCALSLPGEGRIQVRGEDVVEILGGIL